MKPRGNRLQPIQFDWQCGSAECEAKVRQHFETTWSSQELPRSAQSRSSCSGEPDHYLTSYLADRRTSALARIFRFTKQLREAIDAVVVVGACQEPWSSKLIFDTCCPPFWNELNRGERGSKPKMYFLSGESENDQIQSALAMLQRTHREHYLGEQLGWTVLWLEPPRTQRDLSASRVSQALQRYLMEAWSEQFRGTTMRPENCRWGIVQDPCESDARSLDIRAQAEVFPCAEEPTIHRDPCQASLLLPAALLGVNVIELLQGASAVLETLRDPATAGTMVKQLAAMFDLLCDDQLPPNRLVSSSSQCLSALAHWIASIESSWRTTSFSPPTELQTASRAAVRGEILVMVEGDRFDSLGMDAETGRLRNHDRGDDAHLSWTRHRNDRWLAGDRFALSAERVLARIRLPFADELCMGQLMQLLVMAIGLYSLRRSSKVATIESRSGLDMNA